MSEISITMIPVESSNIAAIGYDKETKTLKVQFKGGADYFYKGVPAEHFAKLKDADSLGSYLGKHIKGTYPHEKAEKKEKKETS